MIHPRYMQLMEVHFISQHPFDHPHVPKRLLLADIFKLPPFVFITIPHIVHVACVYMCARGQARLTL